MTLPRPRSTLWPVLLFASSCSCSQKHMERASTSIALNIAEGNGKRSLADRCRYLDIARGYALESAACPDVLVAIGAAREDRVGPGKTTLVRIVAMLFEDGHEPHGVGFRHARPNRARARAVRTRSSPHTH